MFNKNLIKEAHRLAKEIKAEHPEVNYNFQFGLNIKYLLSKVEGVEKVMVELVGSEKQIKWAEQIRIECSKVIDKFIEGAKELKMDENSLKLLNKFKQAFENQKQAQWFINSFRDVLDYKLSYDKQITVFNYDLLNLFNKDRIFPNRLVKYVTMKEHKKGGIN